jgi:Rrf2 family protein
MIRLGVAISIKVQGFTMRRSQKVEHAFRAMLELALDETASAIAVAHIAERAAVPEKFLELILADLRKAGLVQSKRGPAGGYRLARPPETVRLGEIWEAIEGPIDSAPSTRRGERPTATDECLDELWRELDEGVHHAMNELTLADLRRRRGERGDGGDFCI